MTIKYFNFQPNWAEGIIERLEWKTTVAGSPTGAEQRMEMLEAPRRSMEVSILAAGSKRKSADFFLSGRQAETLNVPIWFDSATVNSAASSGGTTISCSTVGHGLIAGTLAVVTSGSSYEVVAISSVSPTALTLSSPLADDWPVGAQVYPVREGRVKDKTSWEQHTASVWTCRVEIELTEPEDVTPDWATITYGGLPVLTILPNMADAMAVEIDRNTIDVDSGIGRPVYVDTAEVSFRTQTHSWLIRGAEDYVSFRAFLQAAAGRLHSFWLPSFAQDFILTENVGSSDTHLTVENCGYVADLWGDVNRRDLYIRLKDGTEVCRRITGTMEAGEVETLTLSSAVGTAFAIDDVDLVCLMSTARLDTDKVELFHPTDVAGATRASAPIRTVPAIRTAPAYDAMPFADTSIRDYTTPPAADAAPLVIARVFWTTKLQTRRGNTEYPLRIDGVDHAVGIEAAALTADGLVEYTGALAVTDLYVELIATDEMGAPLPKEQQPKVWTPYPQYADSQETIGKTTYKHFNPTYAPVYGGAHITWGSALGSLIDAIIFKGQLPHSGDVRSFALNYTRSGSTFGPHRHWRLVIPAVSQDGVNLVAIAGIEFRTAPGGATVTTGGAPFWNTAVDTGHYGSNVFDGNPATDWTPGGGGATPVVGYSLAYGSEADVIQVMVKASATYPTRGPGTALVQYSDERGFWADAWPILFAPWTTAGQEQVFSATFAFPYWRIDIPSPLAAANLAAGPPALSALKLYEEEGGTDIAPTATLTGSTPLNGSVDVDKLNDGSDSSYWSGHPDHIPYVVASFGTPKTLVDMKFQARTDANADQIPTEGYISGSFDNTVYATQWAFLGADCGNLAYGHTQNFPKSFWKNARRIMKTMAANHQHPIVRRAAMLTKINPGYDPAYLLEGAIGVADKVYFEVEWTRIQNYLGDQSRGFVGVTGPIELSASGMERTNYTKVNYRGYSYHDGTGTDLTWSPPLDQGGRMGVAIDRTTGKYKVRFGSGSFHGDLDLGSAHATEPYLFAYFQSYIGFEDQTRGKVYMHAEEFSNAPPSGFVAIGTLGNGSPATVRWDEKDIYGPMLPFGDGTQATTGYQNLDHDVSDANIRGNVAVTGKKYFEIEFRGHPGGRHAGLCKRGATTTTSTVVALSNLPPGLSVSLALSNGNVYGNGSALGSLGGALTGNGVVRMAVDETADLVWFAWNAGAWNGSGANDPAAGTGGITIASLGSDPIYPAACTTVDTDRVASQVVKLRNGSACTYSAPSGFSALS